MDKIRSSSLVGPRGGLDSVVSAPAGGVACQYPFPSMPGPSPYFGPFLRGLGPGYCPRPAEYAGGRAGRELEDLFAWWSRERGARDPHSG